MEPIQKFEMRGFEARALLYEVPQMLGWLLAGAAAAKAFAWVYTNHPDLNAHVLQLIFGGLIVAGLVAVFYAASFFPRRILLHPDRLRFVMAFSSREVPLAEIDSIRVPAADEVKKTFFSPRFVSMSPCLTGAVELRRRRGRAWVFSPADPEELVARVLAAKAASIQAGDRAVQPGPEVSGSQEVSG